MFTLILLSILSLTYFVSVNSSIPFYGELIVPNGTNSTNTTVPSMRDFFKQNLTCEILTIDDSFETLSPIRDIVSPPNFDKVYYNIEHQSCIKFYIAKKFFENIYAEFELDDERDPKMFRGFEIYSHTGARSDQEISNYTVQFYRRNDNDKIILDYTYIPFTSNNNLSLGLWFKLSRDRVEFGYEGNDEPLKVNLFNPKNLILHYSYDESAIFVIKDVENCSAIRPKAQRLITRCVYKNETTNNDDDNNHNGNDTENGNENCPYKNISIELIVLVQQQNVTHTVLRSDSELVDGLLLTYKNATNGIRDFLDRQSELLDDAIRVHKSIMEFQPLSKEDKIFRYNYFMSNLYSVIREMYFKTSLRARSIYGID